jgi:hypothetical protein
MSKDWEMHFVLNSRITIEAVGDSPEAAARRLQRERGRRNLDWLEKHWAEVLPQARGKHLAVAGQEAFIAESASEAWAWAALQHPENDGAFVQYVFPEPGPRFYANRRTMV